MRRKSDNKNKKNKDKMDNKNTKKEKLPYSGNKLL